MIQLLSISATTHCITIVLFWVKENIYLLKKDQLYSTIKPLFVIME